MFVQQGFPCEPFIALLTLERLLTGMLQHMPLPIGGIHEAFIAHLARIRSLLGVRPQMQPKVGFRFETIWAECALEGRFLAVKQTVVMLQIAFPTETFVAQLAHVFRMLWDFRVKFQMGQQIRFGPKRFRTMCAREGLQ